MVAMATREDDAKPQIGIGANSATGGFSGRQGKPIRREQLIDALQHWIPAEPTSSVVARRSHAA